MKLIIPIVLLLSSMLLLSQEQAKAPVDAKCMESVEKAKAATAAFAAVDAERMVAFYAGNAPDLLAEWQKRCAASPEKGLEYTNMLMRNFLEIDRFREANPEEYERLVKQQRTESQIRTISLEIQELAKHDDEKERLGELKLKLKKLMEDAFDDAQRRQLLEINRLENEVRNLRNLAEQRAANRQKILQQRFMLMTDGQEWPK
ncbi:MAG: hypothetical protein J5833_01260 [Victivallales bacterium]|nr:hypothetical protein [Victivallales bacterium]